MNLQCSGKQWAMIHRVSNLEVNVCYLDITALLKPRFDMIARISCDARMAVVRPRKTYLTHPVFYYFHSCPVNK